MRLACESCLRFGWIVLWSRYCFKKQLGLDSWLNLRQEPRLMSMRLFALWLPFMAAHSRSRKTRQLLLRRFTGSPTRMGRRQDWTPGGGCLPTEPLEAIMAHDSISVHGRTDTAAAQLLIGQLRALGIFVMEPPRPWTATDDLQYRACVAAARVCRKAAKKPAKTGLA